MNTKKYIYTQMLRKAVQQIKIIYTDFFKYTYISFNTIYDLNIILC